MTSRQRVQCLLQGGQPDRPPHFDLLRNDAIFSHFAREPLRDDNAERVVFRTFQLAVDGTRPLVRLPQQPRRETLPDGRRLVVERWTDWVEHDQEPNLSAFADKLEQRLATRLRWTAKNDEQLATYIDHHQRLEHKLEDVYLFWSQPGIGLHELYNELGLEAFSYFLADYPDLVTQWLEAATTHSLEHMRRAAAQAHPPAYFIGEDIAAKGSLIFNPLFLRRHFFPHLQRLVGQAHDLQAKVMFHSDGNIMSILDDLLACRIDALNPIEVAAGMDIGQLHRRAPQLILVGGIDTSGVLARGTPEQVSHAVTQALADAEGRIMIGSSSEVHEAVPLPNYLAMLEAIGATPAEHCLP